MAAKRKASKCSRDRASLIRYLTGTIIPDTVEAGRDATAKDLRAGLAFLQGARTVTVSGHRYTPDSFCEYLWDTLIPDFEESDSGYAEDFREIANLIQTCTVRVRRD